MSLDKQLEKIAKIDGVKNASDIYDQSTFDSLQKEIEGIKRNKRERS